MEQNIQLYQGIQAQLLPEKALFIPEWQALIIADLHLGKAESFQQKGIALPSGADEADLDLLSQLIVRHGANKLVIAGDVFHKPKTMSLSLRGQLKRWLDSLEGCEIVFALGNHDRALELEEHAKLRLCDEYFLSEQIFVSHHPTDSASKISNFRICGHLHPVVALRSSLDRLRLPCFVHAAHQIILPAFSSLAGGFAVDRKEKEKIYVIAEGSVVPLPTL